MSAAAADAPAGGPFRHDLLIRRGARFDPVGWVVRDLDTGEPLRSAGGLEVSAVVRRWRGDDRVLHAFTASAVLHTFAGQYGDAPVAVAQLDEMSPAETGALGFDRGVYAVFVSGDYIGGGRVSLPRVAP